MAKFCPFLTELSARSTTIFSSPFDNVSKYQWIFTKLDMCIDIVAIWFEIGNSQNLSIFDSYLHATRPNFCFLTIS